MGLKQKPSNAWNLQSNAILERIHQVLGDCLVTFDLENTPIMLTTKILPMSTSLQWPMQLDHRIINHMDTHQLNLYLEEICSLQLKQKLIGRQLKITNKQKINRKNMREILTTIKRVTSSP